MEVPLSDSHADELHSLATARWRVAIALTIAMIVMYFGFIVLIAYNKAFLARTIVPGLTIGIALGAGVIVVSWLLTYVYVHWTNTRYDARLAELQRVSSPGVDGATPR